MVADEGLGVHSLTFGNLKHACRWDATLSYNAGVTLQSRVRYRASLRWRESRKSVSWARP